MKMPDRFNITAVADPRAEKRKIAEGQLNCKSYADYTEILYRKEKVGDLIINTLPSHLHCESSIKMMKAGFHVLCEKPAARTVDEIDRMIECSRATGKVLAIYQNLGYFPHVAKIKEIIDSGVLGRIAAVELKAGSFQRRYDWQSMLKYNGGNIYNKGAHLIDQAMQLFEFKRIPEVYGMMDRVISLGDADDFTKIIIRDELLPVMDLEMSSCRVYNDYIINVQGSLGGLVCKDEHHIKWKYFRPEEAPELELTETPIDDYCKDNLTWYENEWVCPDEIRDLFPYAHMKLYYNIYDVLANNGKLNNTPEKARIQLSIIEKCREQNSRFVYSGE